MEPSWKPQEHDPFTNEVVVCSVRDAARQHIKHVVDQEVELLDDVTPQTWKIAVHNVTKHVKESPQMHVFLKSVKDSLHSFAERSPADHPREPTPTFKIQACASLAAPCASWNETNRGMHHAKHHLQLAEDISHYKPLKTRIEAFKVLLNTQLPDAIPNENWSQLQKNLQESLCDMDSGIFAMSLKIHSKLISSSTTANIIKEGYLNLIDGLRTFYSRKFHRLLPNFENGIELNNPIHQRIVRISHLILETIKDLPKTWVRMGERNVEEIMNVFLALITMHTYDSMYSKNILYPFHIIAALDPNAKWCLYWLHGGYGRNIMLSLKSRILTLLRYAVEEIDLYLRSSSLKSVSVDPKAKSSWTDIITKETDFIYTETIKLVTFCHCVNVLSDIASYKKGIAYFPIKSKIKNEPVVLEEIFSIMIGNCNENQYSNSNFPIDNIIINATVKLLKLRECPLLHSNFIRVVLEPILNLNNSINDVPMGNVPWHTVRILDTLCESESGILYLLNIDKRTKTRIKSSCLLATESPHEAEESDSTLSKDTDKDPFNIIMDYTAYLLQNKAYSADSLILLIGICGNFFSYDFFSILEVSDIPLIQTALETYKRLYFQSVQNSDGLENSNTCAQSEELLRALSTFLTRVGRWPQGMFTLSQHKSLVANLTRSLFQEPCIPWESAEFRRVITILCTLPEGAFTLANDCGRAITQIMCDLWTALEDQESLIHGSDRVPDKAMMFFMDIIYSLTCTVTGTEAFLSEHEGSEDTLLECGPYPTTMLELLTLGNFGDPWHYQALLTLRVVTSNLDNWLYLEMKLHIQEQLLQLQSENVLSPLDDELETSDKSKQNTNIIIDECSVLRHQILVATYVIGGPNERTIPEFSEELSIFEPLLIQDITDLEKYSNISYTKPKIHNELQKLLQDSKASLHDASWLVRARKAFRTIRHDHMKPSLVLELLEQVARCSLIPNCTINWLIDYEGDLPSLCPEENLGVQMAVRYGTQRQLLDTTASNEAELKELFLHTQRALKYTRNNVNFKGFDWFLASVFLLSSGNLERCRHSLDNLTALPTSIILWQTLAEAKGIFHLGLIFSSLVESVIAVELPLASSALKAAGIPWGLVCSCWIGQCFWNILDWNQVCQWIALCILYPPDMTVYFCAGLLKYLEPEILEASSYGKIWEKIKLVPMSGFLISDYTAFMEKLIKRHRSTILPKLLEKIAIDER